MRLLLTGATGKVGQNFLEKFLSDPVRSNAVVVALCNNRTVVEHERIEIVKGSLSDQETVEKAMMGVTHVVHLAAVKETPQLAMDVAIKGMFWLLEAFRNSPTAEQFIHMSGDCSVGHFHQPHDGPVTEKSPLKAYKGVYALTKALEEVMLSQYYEQYDINGCCLRAPWIMEKDDFKYVLSFGDDQFGGPAWSEFVAQEKVNQYHRDNCVPVMRDHTGAPMLRNFVHVHDLVDAILAALDNPRAHQQLFNISMNEPINYEQVGAYLNETQGLNPVDIPTQLYSNWLDNSKARQYLNWSPKYDLKRLVDEAFSYSRADNDPRKIWYPG